MRKSLIVLLYAAVFVAAVALKADTIAAVDMGTDAPLLRSLDMKLYGNVCVPPTSGDWTITAGTTCTCNAEAWRIPANVHVYGTLDMQYNCTLAFDNSTSKIYVYSGGKVYVGTGSSFNTGWMNDRRYRVAHNITGSTYGALTDYAMSITVYNSSDMLASMYPTDDTWTDLVNPDTNNNGTGSAVCTNYSSSRWRIPYFKFDIGPLAGKTILSANMSLYQISYLPSGWSYGSVTAYEVDDDTWSEGTLTWNNKPAKGASIQTVSCSAGNTWYNWNVTDYLQGEIDSSQPNITIAMDRAYGSQYSSFGTKDYNSSAFSPILYVAYRTSESSSPGVDYSPRVYLPGKTKSNFSDVRFTNSSGVPLDYYMVSEYDSKNATFWVKMGSIPESPGSATIYIYYDNTSNAATQSDLNRTLEYIGTENSTVNTGFGSGSTYSTKSFVCPYDSKIVVWNVYASPGSTGFKLKTTSSADVVNSSSSSSYTLVSGWNMFNESLTCPSGGNLGMYTGSSTTYVLVKNTSSSIKYVSGDASVGTTLSSSTTGYYFAFNARLRKYVLPEPTHGKWGAEETKP